MEETEHWSAVTGYSGSGVLSEQGGTTVVSERQTIQRANINMYVLQKVYLRSGEYVQLHSDTMEGAALRINFCVTMSQIAPI